MVFCYGTPDHVTTTARDLHSTNKSVFLMSCHVFDPRAKSCCGNPFFSPLRITMSMNFQKFERKNAVCLGLTFESILTLKFSFNSQGRLLLEDLMIELQRTNLAVSLRLNKGPCIL